MPSQHSQNTQHRDPGFWGTPGRHTCWCALPAGTLDHKTQLPTSSKLPPASLWLFCSMREWELLPAGPGGGGTGRGLRGAEGSTKAFVTHERQA